MFTWIPDITTGDILTTVSILAAAVGLFLNYLELQRSSRRHRAELTIRFYEMLNDGDVLDMWEHVIYESGPADYDKLTRRQKSALDGLLTYYNTIAVLVNDGLVKDRDIQPIIYDLGVIAKSKAVEACLNMQPPAYDALATWIARRKPETQGEPHR